MASSVDLFPTDRPAEPDELIGRNDEILGLVDDLTARRHRIVVGAGQVGKTSTAVAATEALAAGGWRVVRVDLARLDGPDELTSELLRITLPDDDEAPNDPEVCEAVGAVDALAAREGRPVVLFIDNFHEIATTQIFGKPVTIGKELRFALDEAANISCLFVGSAATTMRDYFGAKGKPFQQFGEILVLDPITEDSWREGLSERFETGGRTIASDALERLVELGEGHPRSTMLIARHTYAVGATQDPHRILADAVDAGFRLACAAERRLVRHRFAQIRTLSKHSFSTAIRVAKGNSPYKNLPPAVARQTLRGLETAGVIDHPHSGTYQIADPMLRHHLLTATDGRLDDDSSDELDVYRSIAHMLSSAATQHIDAPAYSSPEPAVEAPVESDLDHEAVASPTVPDGDDISHAEPDPVTGSVELPSITALTWVDDGEPSMQLDGPRPSDSHADEAERELTAARQPMAGVVPRQPAEVDVERDDGVVAVGGTVEEAFDVTATIGDEVNAATDDEFDHPQPSTDEADDSDGSVPRVEAPEEPDPNDPTPEHGISLPDIDELLREELFAVDADVTDQGATTPDDADSSDDGQATMRLRQPDHEEAHAVEKTVEQALRTHELDTSRRRGRDVPARQHVIKRAANFAGVSTRRGRYWQLETDRGHPVGGAVLHRPAGFAGTSTLTGIDPVVHAILLAVTGILVVAGTVLAVANRAWEWGAFSGLIFAAFIASAVQIAVLLPGALGRARASQLARRHDGVVIGATWSDSSDPTPVLSALAQERPDRYVSGYVDTHEDLESFRAMGFSIARGRVVSGVLNPRGNHPVRPAVTATGRRTSATPSRRRQAGLLTILRRRIRYRTPAARPSRPRAHRSVAQHRNRSRPVAPSTNTKRAVTRRKQRRQMAAKSRAANRRNGH